MPKDLSPLLPVRLNWLLRMPWNIDRSVAEILQQYHDSTFSSFEPLNLVRRAIPDNINMEVIEILPRLKDAGCFVKFAHSEEVTAKDIEGLLLKTVRVSKIC